MGGLVSRKLKTRAKKAEHIGAESGRHARAKPASNTCAAHVMITEQVDGSRDRAEHGRAFLLDLSAQRKGRKAARIKPPDAQTTRALAAVGHAQRAKILAKLLEGPATYRALQSVTRLKAGPLYHHVNELRLAGLILPKQRDLYELTRGGRNAIMVACVMQKLLRDRRRRPIPTGKE